LYPCNLAAPALGTGAPKAASRIKAKHGTAQGSLQGKLTIRIPARFFLESFFSAAASCLSALDINFLNILSRIGENGYLIGLDLNHAAGNGKDFFFAAHPNCNIAILQHRKQGGVVRQDAHHTFYPGQDYNIYIALENNSILRDDFTTNGHDCS